MPMTDEQILEREIRRSKLWGKLTFGQVMDTLERQHDALTAIVAMKNDTLGARPGGFEKESTEHFDRGCRMAFYRCADVAAKALNQE